MRKTTAVLAGAAVAATGVLAAPTALGAGTVKVGDNWFIRSSGVPSTSANPGERVLFRWVGRKPHNVSVKSGPSRFASTTKSSGTYRSPKLKKGTYVLICTVHGQRDQSMKIVVR